MQRLSTIKAGITATLFGSITLMCVAPTYAQNAVQSPVAAKSSAPGQPAPEVASARKSQQEVAQTAMQQSLARQQAAIQSLREHLETGSVSAQRESVRKQYASLHGTAQQPPALGSAALTGINPKEPVNGQPQDAAPDSDQQASLASQKEFFGQPWPKSVPLSVPNVQVVDETCQALSKDQVEKLVSEASGHSGVDVNLIRSVMHQESGFKPCALSTAGAMGLMQIMPETAETLGLDDPFDPAKNVEAGAKYLKSMLDRYQGDVSMALGAYNAGPGRVDKAGGVPPIPETIDYVTKVLGDLPAAY